MKFKKGDTVFANQGNFTFECKVYSIEFGKYRLTDSLGNGSSLRYAVDLYRTRTEAETARNKGGKNER